MAPAERIAGDKIVKKSDNGKHDYVVLYRKAATSSALTSGASLPHWVRS